jgi:hypothetical protein
MADRWLCPTIWPELIDDGKLLAEQLKSQVATRARDELGVEHMPTIRGFNPGLVDKTSKIGGLTLRFEYGKIKLPFANRNTPHWRHLFEQIEGFNPDVEDGGLQNDDHLDTVSMSQFVIKGRPSKRGEEKSQPEAALARLLEGETHDSHGTPLAYFVDFSTLTVEDFGKVLSTVRQQATTPGASKL